MRRLHRILAVFASVACSPASQTPAASQPGCAPDNAGITLPPGFCASIFADSLGLARYVAVAANGDVYVSIDGTRLRPPSQPVPPWAFIALRDANGDGRAEVIYRGGKIGNTGLALYDGYLYVDEGERIVRYRRGANDLRPSLKAEVIVQALPLYPGHRSRNFAIGADGSMYVNIGSASNSCQMDNAMLESPGHDPCAELETRAGIWKFDADAPKQWFAPSARYATGVRNATGIAFSPGGQLYAMSHGRDQLTENWPRVFPDALYGTHNPAETLLRVSQGDDFGWPYCYYSFVTNGFVTAPEYGGDGIKAARCGGVRSPAAVFPAHWAPLDLHFYSGDMFPAKYRNGAFIAFHGSFNRAPGLQAGGKIVFQPFVDDAPSGAFEIFADGFAGISPAELDTLNVMHRPVGLATGPDGAMYVADDKGGRIYKIVYRGN